MTYRTYDGDNGDNNPYQARAEALFTDGGQVILTGATVDGFMSTLTAPHVKSDQFGLARHQVRVIGSENPFFKGGVMESSLRLAGHKPDTSFVRGVSYGMNMAYTLLARGIEDNGQAVLQTYGRNGEITSLDDLKDCLSARLGANEAGVYLGFIDKISEHLTTLSYAFFREQSKGKVRDLKDEGEARARVHPADPAREGLIRKMADYAAAPLGSKSLDPIKSQRGPNYVHPSQKPLDELE